MSLFLNFLRRAELIFLIYYLKEKNVLQQLHICMMDHVLVLVRLLAIIQPPINYVPLVLVIANIVLDPLIVHVPSVMIHTILHYQAAL